MYMTGELRSMLQLGIGNFLAFYFYCNSTAQSAFRVERSDIKGSMKKRFLKRRIIIDNILVDFRKKF